MSQHLAGKHVCNHGEDSSEPKYPLAAHKDFVMMKSPRGTDLSGKCGKRVRAQKEWPRCDLWPLQKVPTRTPSSVLILNLNLNPGCPQLLWPQNKLEDTKVLFLVAPFTEPSRSNKVVLVSRCLCKEKGRAENRHLDMLSWMKPWLLSATLEYQAQLFLRQHVPPVLVEFWDHILIYIQVCSVCESVILRKIKHNGG